MIGQFELNIFQCQDIIYKVVILCVGVVCGVWCGMWFYNANGTVCES